MKSFAFKKRTLHATCGCQAHNSQHQSLPDSVRPAPGCQEWVFSFSVERWEMWHRKRYRILWFYMKYNVYVIHTCISYFFSRIVSTWFFTFEIKVYQERSEDSGYPWRTATERGCIELLGCYSCSVSWSGCWIQMHIQLVAIHHNCKLMIWALFCVCCTSSKSFLKSAYRENKILFWMANHFFHRVF